MNTRSKGKDTQATDTEADEQQVTTNNIPSDCRQLMRLRSNREEDESVQGPQFNSPSQRKPRCRKQQSLMETRLLTKEPVWRTFKMKKVKKVKMKKVIVRAWKVKRNPDPGRPSTWVRSNCFFFSRADDKLALVSVVKRNGKNWQKVLDILQKDQHRFLHIPLDKYSKLLSTYKSIKGSLENPVYKWPKVPDRFLV